MLKLATGTRLLDGRDVAEVADLLDRDPVVDLFVAARVALSGVHESRLGAQLWGYGERGALEAICYSGANLVPVQAGPEAARAFAERARRQGRRCSSIVGEVDAVREMWLLLEGAWGKAREIRDQQPVLAIDHAPAVAPDPAVRRVRLDELDLLLPSAIAMFTEEIGVSPVSGPKDTSYRDRVAELVKAGRAFARIENGRVLFKAEVGAVSPYACQVQGVWVPPELRGQGLSLAGMAAVVERARADVAPVVSLYVNDFNIAARRAYARIGMREVGRLTSVLF